MTILGLLAIGGWGCFGFVFDGVRCAGGVDIRTFDLVDMEVDLIVVDYREVVVGNSLSLAYYNCCFDSASLYFIY